LTPSRGTEKTQQGIETIIGREDDDGLGASRHRENPAGD
jgi:hypothetical protein